MIHSVDFHAAIGPGGGAEFIQADPGQEKIVTFKALVPGLYVYHCATPSVPHHIATVVDFKIRRAARYTIVDHALRGSSEASSAL
jgi:hypothetical protein